jgi:hypothetical protein
MVYTNGKEICADSRNELFIFARSTGMDTRWYKDFIDHGYFQIFGNVRKLIMRAAGVKLLTWEQFEEKAKQMYANGQKLTVIVLAMQNETEKQEIKYNIAKYRNPYKKTRKETGTAGSKRANLQTRKAIERSED